MKKLLAFVLVTLMVLSLTACGGSGNADSKYEGKYISVTGEYLGMVLSGDEISGFGIELKSGGKGALIVDGESGNGKWSNEGDVITIEIDGEQLVATYSEDTLTFDDFLGMGMKLIFAREGSAAADPSLYIPEEDKALVGTWTSYAVADVLGEDMSGEIDPTGLTITFNGDYTASGEINGVDLELEGYTWSMMDGWGFFDDNDESVISSWELTGDGNLEVTYDDGDNYYVFICTQ